jgi:hypothetical protein
MAHLSGDEVLRARVVRDLGPRSFLLPSWMQQLNKVEIVAAEQVTDTVRDGYDIVIHARLAGHDLTTVTFIDFNMGVLVKDNLLSDRPLESFNEVWREHAIPGTRSSAVTRRCPRPDQRRDRGRGHDVAAGGIRGLAGRPTVAGVDPSTDTGGRNRFRTPRVV